MNFVRYVVGLTVLSSLCLAATPSIASASSVAGPSDERQYTSTVDSSVPPPGPGDLTWAQASSRSWNSTFTDPSLTRSSPTSRTSSMATTGGVGCSINTGSVYKRASGSAYNYGTVGGKPRTTCTVPMVSIQQTTTLYKTVWWGLQRVAGPFTSRNAGEGTLVQLNVQRVCDSLSTTTFRMEVRSTGVFPTGTTGSASAFETASLPCGTRP